MEQEKDGVDLKVSTPATDGIVDTILVTSDWHFGKRQYGLAKRESDFYEAGNVVADYAIKHGIRLIINSGDLLDVKRPSRDAMSAVDAINRKLKDAGITMLCVMGNHDNTGNRSWCSLLDGHDRNFGVKDVTGRMLNADGVAISSVESFSKSDLVYEITGRRRELARADIVVLHCPAKQFTKEFDWNPIFDAESDYLDIVQPAKRQILVVGDTHIHKMVTLSNPDITVLSPGSIEMVYRNEASTKYFFVVKLARDRAIPPVIESVAVPTVSYTRLENKNNPILTDSALKSFISENIRKLGIRIRSSRFMVYLYYDPVAVTDAVTRVRTALKPSPQSYVIGIPVRHASDDKAGDIAVDEGLLNRLNGGKNGQPSAARCVDLREFAGAAFSSTSMENDDNTVEVNKAVDGLSDKGKDLVLGLLTREKTDDELSDMLAEYTKG